MDRAGKWPDEARAAHVGFVTVRFMHAWEAHGRAARDWYLWIQEAKNRAILWNWQRREEAAGTYFTGD